MIQLLQKVTEPEIGTLATRWQHDKELFLRLPLLLGVASLQHCP